MKSFHTQLAGILTGMIIVATVFAQSTTPGKPTEPSDPSAASSPHQRAVTKSPSAEAPTSSATSPSDAGTPHQKQTVKKKKHRKNAQSNTPGS